MSGSLRLRGSKSRCSDNSRGSDNSKESDHRNSGSSRRRGVLLSSVSADRKKGKHGIGRAGSNLSHKSGNSEAKPDEQHRYQPRFGGLAAIRKQQEEIAAKSKKIGIITDLE